MELSHNNQGLGDVKVFQKCISASHFYRGTCFIIPYHEDRGLDLLMEQSLANDDNTDERSARNTLYLWS